jgi:hypothetical protein
MILKYHHVMTLYTQKFTTKISKINQLYAQKLDRFSYALTIVAILLPDYPADACFGDSLSHNYPMKLYRSDLDQAVLKGIMAKEQAETLWSFLESKEESQPRFNLSNVIYYLGGLIVISSMSWFMVTAWERLGGPGIFFISTIYGLGFFFGAKHLWFEKDLRIPGGILFTAAVWMTPLAVYGLERWTGWWPQSDPGTYHDYHVFVKGS